MAKRLDARDRKILTLLEENCRKPHSVIAREVGISKQLAAYRINAMVKSHVISRFITIINHHKLGYMSYNVLIKLQYVGQDLEQQIIDDLTNMGKVGWVVSAIGQWDLVVAVLVRDPKEYAEWLDDLYSKHGKHIHSHIYYIVTETIPSKSQVMRKEQLRRFGSEWDASELKPVDISILQCLNINPRMPIVQLGQEAKSRPETIRSRLEHLRRQQILLGSSIKVNPKAVDNEWYNLLLDLDYGHGERRTLLLNKLLANPKVTFVVETVGMCTMVVDVHVTDSVDLKTFIKDFYGEFTDIIKGYQPLLVLKEHKCRFLPDDFMLP